MLHNSDRRSFIKVAGMGTAGLMLSNGLINASTYSNFKPKVAVAKAFDYDRKTIRTNIENMFNAIGGLEDIVSSSSKVGIKINLTGGYDSAVHPKNLGLPATETYWSHPEVVRAVCELMIDSGVNPSKLFLVEALWGYDTYIKPGFEELQKHIGAKLVNLNSPDPYTDFAKLPVKNGFYYNFFYMNPILSEFDTFVSIAKMKQHSLAGVTLAMKNLYGVVPMHKYQYPGKEGYRSAMHHENGTPGEHVPRTVCDLNMARPIHLAVIDGIKSSLGGEATWCDTFAPHSFNTLVAGKDPVATDSVASTFMGYNPEDDHFKRPSGELAINHFKLAAGKNLGQNILSKIEIKEVS